jgi:heme exporter protein A
VSGAAADGAAAVRARGLRKAFGARIALDGVDLDLAAGTFLTLMGPNGSGKTTLLRLLAGLSRPSGGELRVLGAVPGPGAAALRARVGFVSHEPQLYADLSAEENLRFFAALYAVPDREARIDASLGRVELGARRRDPVRALSRGMTQRLSIARALLHEPGLLLLDEPTTGLDDRALGILVDLLAELHDGRRTLILTTHRLDVGLRVADRIAVQARGRIVHEAQARALDPAAFAARYASLTAEAPA